MRAERPAPRARPGEHARGRHFSFAKELSNAMDWVFLCQVLFPVFFAAGLLLAGAYCAGLFGPARAAPVGAVPCRSRVRVRGPVLHLRAAGGMTGQTKRQGPGARARPLLLFPMN